MNDIINERESLWTEFLERWPLESLSDMRLKDYSQAGSQDSFVYWLEFKARDLGSIAGGAATKFGIYSRDDQEDKPSTKRQNYTKDYSWYQKYGSTEEEAFLKVKEIILNIANAAKEGRHDSIEKADLGPSIKWKIAFLYQNRDAISVVPIYKPEWLQLALDIKQKQVSELQKQLIAKWHLSESYNTKESIFDFADTVLSEIKSKIKTKPTQKEAKKLFDDSELTHLPSPQRSPLNQIFYGPPGTGKTFATINAALEILDPNFLLKHCDERKRLKERYDSLVSKGYIRFVTFHQSFSYEDFVEGIRAESLDNGELIYKVVDGVFKNLSLSTTSTDNTSTNAKVLIIDEINRGNISRIFGELITLIEPSKRKGSTESLEITLPYSKSSFSVPNNLYIIGTMNTADRSLTSLDIALRRRFIFKETPPNPDLLNDVFIEGINIGKLLSIINERIEVLLDRDHCLGHAYFIPLKDNPEAQLTDLESIFHLNVIPLLQEYFFENWERIQWILNDHRKPEKFRFITQHEVEPSLFGENVNINLQHGIWRVNKKAFKTKEAYLGITETLETGEM